LWLSKEREFGEEWRKSEGDEGVEWKRKLLGFLREEEVEDNMVIVLLNRNNEDDRSITRLTFTLFFSFDGFWLYSNFQLRWWYPRPWHIP